MLKKVSKIVTLFCLLAFAGNSFAQETEIPVYPQYGFWSNWGIGVTGSFDYQHDVNAFYGISDRYWGGGFNAGFGVVLQKEIERGAWLRFRYNHPTLLNKGMNNDKATWSNSTYGVSDTAISMDRHHQLTMDLVLSLNNSFHNWNPETRWDLYVFGGGGLAFSANNGRDFGTYGVQLEVGLGYDYRICEKSTLFFELEADILSDAPSFFFGNNGGTSLHHTNFLASVGYIYNLGLTAADKELIAQRALLSKENFDALSEENDALKKEVASAKDSERKLKGQIDNLANENEQLRKRAVAHSEDVDNNLKATLEQLKKDQLNFYAIPFSVLYPSDGWRVSDAEMAKVKAVSQIMKDNSDIKITVIGFCDYTASDEYNMKLSQKRAEEVKRIMVNKYGVDEDRISCDWKGKSVPFGDSHYGINRRVSFYRVIE